MSHGILFITPNPSVDRSYELDHLAEGEIHRPRRVVVVPGGKGLNAARAAARLGARVSVVALSQGSSGRWIEEGIEGAGIEGFWARAPGDTRTCVSILDVANQKLTEVYEHGAEISVETWNELERLTAEAMGRAQPTLAVMAGSLPPGAPTDGYARLARIVTNGGAQVLLDTHGAELRAAIGESLAVVKLNRSEAEELVGAPVRSIADAIRATRELRGLGPGIAIVTLGADGAVAAGSGISIHVEVPTPGGLYTVGSGDAFFGALATGLLQARDLVPALRLAVATATASSFVLGTGDFDSETARALVDDVTVTDQ